LTSDATRYWYTRWHCYWSNSNPIYNRIFTVRPISLSKNERTCA
jgi:hypothetical protein